MEQLTVEQWRERILRGWERWGTGEPLDPRTVEHLAQEFAKPLEWPKAPLAGMPPWPGLGSVFSKMVADPLVDPNRIEYRPNRRAG